MKSLLKKIDNLFFRHLEDDYIKALKKECDGCETLLDVGCGANSPIQYFSRTIKYSVGVDSFAPSINKSKAAGIHNEYALMSVMELPSRFPENSFDYVVALDLFEHLEKDDGYRLISMMEKIARKKIVIFTPNGFQKQREFDCNPHQVHLSEWEVDEIRGTLYLQPPETCICPSLCEGKACIGIAFCRKWFVYMVVNRRCTIWSE